MYSGMCLVWVRCGGTSHRRVYRISESGLVMQRISFGEKDALMLLHAVKSEIPFWEREIKEETDLCDVAHNQLARLYGIRHRLLKFLVKRCGHNLKVLQGEQA